MITALVDHPYTRHGTKGDKVGVSIAINHPVVYTFPINSQKWYISTRAIYEQINIIGLHSALEGTRPVRVSEPVSMD